MRSISSCPEIQPGDGCVVTGTFTHLNDDVHELTFVGSDVVLQPTGLHPLWSEDRDGWVRTHKLKVGERLRSEQGPLEIATIRRLEGAHQVFNLEVASDHTYLVSDSAILSHNECGDGLTPRAARRKAMREAGIPTSQQPVSQQSAGKWTNDGYSKAGRQYTYEVPSDGGGTKKMSVQHSLSDDVPGHGPHWEAGQVKKGGERDPTGRRLRGDKVKVIE